jgi:phosphotransferase system enzyme I (PtsP)
MAILARSLGIPLVFAKDSSLASAPESVPVLIDAAQGTIYLNPAAEVMDQYREYLDTRGKMSDAIATAASETWTEDGRRVHLQANLNLLSELEIVHAVKAEGIGLYRSEFPYIVRNDFPSEEELFRIYRRIVEAMEGREVVFRTLDVGGDKMLSYFPSVSEANPFLGLRAIRFSLRHREIFDQQLRALLRAGAGAELSIMFPLVSSVDDFLAARRAVRECIEELENERMECNASPRLGIMVELPAAVELADAFAAEADFLCIGTNDLIQYMLAADRTNQQISEYYVPHHPAVLRALKRVATAAAAAGKPVSLCGELATDHRLVPYLLGIGITKLSMDARRIPEVQRLVSSLQITAAEEFADRLLRLPTVTAVEEALGKA